MREDLMEGQAELLAVVSDARWTLGPDWMDKLH